MRVVIRSSAGPGLLAGALTLVTCLVAFNVSFAVLQGRWVGSNAGLGMRVQMQGDAIVLTWNRDKHAVRFATKGVLQIADGSRTHRTVLEPDQLANGSVLYNPSQATVDFNLTVYATDGSTITDHLQVPASHRPSAMAATRLKPS